jgi:hypothetical protein
MSTAQNTRLVSGKFVQRQLKHVHFMISMQPAVGCGQLQVLPAAVGSSVATIATECRPGLALSRYIRHSKSA